MLKEKSLYVILTLYSVKKPISPINSVYRVIHIRKRKMNLFENIKCAVFDVDGTLLDSMGMWNSITYEYADFKNIYAPEDLSKRMNKLSLTGCAMLYKELGAEGTVEEIAAEIVEMARERYRAVIKEKPGAREFIKSLREKGVHIAIATASDIGGLMPALKREGIAGFIEFAISCEDIGKGKSQPDVYLKCAEHFGAAPEECIVFEDALYASKTAKNAGFKLVAVDEACYTKEDKEELKKISDLYICSYSEIIKELK